MTIGPLVFHIRSQEYAVLSDAFKFHRLCENEMSLSIEHVNVNL